MLTVLQVSEALVQDPDSLVHVLLLLEDVLAQSLPLQRSLQVLHPPALQPSLLPGLPPPS